MLGLKRLEAAFVYAATPAVFTPAVDAGTGEGLLELGFQVEEAEMFVHLSARLLLDTGANETYNLTFFVDGADVETVGTLGLWQTDLLIAAEGPTSLKIEKTVRLAQGFHTAEVRIRTNAGGGGVATISGDIIPAELEARRSSHPATLAHGVDSKVQLVQ